MLELVFTVEDLARTRLAVSPLWELVASVRLLKNPRGRTFHQRWVTATQERIADSSADLGLLFDLVDPRVWYTADFLTPPPRTPVPDLTSDLGAVLLTSPEQIRAELDVLVYALKHPIGALGDASVPRGRRPVTPADLPSAAVAELYAEPEAGIRRLVDQLERYWDLAIGPQWGRIRTLLEQDLLYRGRRLGQAGHSALFDDLADTVRWKAGSLLIRHRRFTGVRRLAGEGLLLLPSAFVWPTVYSSTIPPWQPSLVYPARGIATLWENSSATVPSGLAQVLGRSRAMLLAHLDAPRSTTDLAMQTGLTPSGVSQHLSALRAAKLVTPHRAGRSVLYARTAVAESLLASSRE